MVTVGMSMGRKRKNSCEDLSIVVCYMSVEHWEHLGLSKKEGGGKPNVSH